MALHKCFPPEDTRITSRRVRKLTPYVLGAFAALISVCCIAFKWTPNHFQQPYSSRAVSNPTDWDQAMMDLFAGRYLFAMWPFYCLAPYIVPPTTLRPTPKHWTPQQRHGIRAIAGTCIVLSYVLCISLGVHRATIRMYEDPEAPYTFATYVGGTCILNLPTLIALGHLVPSSPSLISKMGENTFMCLFWQWILVSARPYISTAWRSRLLFPEGREDSSLPRSSQMGR